MSFLDRTSMFWTGLSGRIKNAKLVAYTTSLDKRLDLGFVRLTTSFSKRHHRSIASAVRRLLIEQSLYEDISMGKQY